MVAFNFSNTLCTKHYGVDVGQTTRFRRSEIKAHRRSYYYEHHRLVRSSGQGVVSVCMQYHTRARARESAMDLDESRVRDRLFRRQHRTGGMTDRRERDRAGEKERERKSEGERKRERQRVCERERVVAAARQSSYIPSRPEVDVSPATLVACRVSRTPCVWAG